MDYERYDYVVVSEDTREFKFTSSGPNGSFVIAVQFVKADLPGVYNLAFGNLLANGRIDDLVRNNNSDRNKILATVAMAVYEFSSANPEKSIYFTGSTPQRTRLYRMAITINLLVLNQHFEIFVIITGKHAFTIEVFKKGVEYSGFYIIRKNN